MSVFFVESYAVGLENMGELAALLTKFSILIKEKPEKFSGLQSYRAFSRMVGEFGAHTEIWEFESMNDIESMFKTMFSDEELKEILAKFFALVEPGTYGNELWSSLVEYRAQSARPTP